MKVSKSDIEKFSSDGWVVLDMGLEHHRLINYAQTIRRMRDRAVEKNYEFRRVWWDYFGYDNIAAIELPFSSDVCDESIFTLFLELELNDVVESLMGWKGSFCSLARIFCMNNFKYRGNWHRDFSELVTKRDELNCVQIAIYVQDQPGFRILKKEFDADYFTDPNLERAFIEVGMPLELPEDSYFEVEGKAGTILLFNPSLFHQGSSSSERLDFHMRFLRSDFTLGDPSFNFDKKLGFSVLDYLASEFDTSDLLPSAGIPKESRSCLVRRFANSVNYQTGILNLIRWFKIHGSYKKLQGGLPVKPDLLANTKFQK